MATLKIEMNDNTALVAKTAIVAFAWTVVFVGWPWKRRQVINQTIVQPAQPEPLEIRLPESDEETGFKHV